MKHTALPSLGVRPVVDLSLTVTHRNRDWTATQSTRVKEIWNHRKMFAISAGHDLSISHRAQHIVPPATTATETMKPNPTDW